jgi:hypothetical protein
MRHCASLAGSSTDRNRKLEANPAVRYCSYALRNFQPTKLILNSDEIERENARETKEEFYARNEQICGGSPRETPHDTNHAIVHGTSYGTTHEQGSDRTTSRERAGAAGYTLPEVETAKGWAQSPECYSRCSESARSADRFGCY